MDTDMPDRMDALADELEELAATELLADDADFMRRIAAQIRERFSS